MTDNDVAALLIFVLFGGGIALAIANRFCAHAERIEMIRRGIVPPPDWRTQRMRERMASAEWAGRRCSSRGLDPVAASRRQLHRGIWLTFVGLALTIGLSFIGYHPGDGLFGFPTITPGPWLLGGLIPLFVGLAKVVTALLSMSDTKTTSGQGAAPSAPPGEPAPPWGERVRQVLDPEREIPPPTQPPAHP